ncbi:sigma-70 region 4 domain-containing protein [Belliella sp. DSM 107340]|uniref:Sigma-70 region 4 domain-containing protein n=1 Tax=Belliella calami TaxID=2923436 RepID=A0ABS9US84_9BACT|nr:sigma-70 region 4 domain-containing protein [Belliella calami]MCH7399358.1 sigma-70 region 4 domain-containing protein [Belliella calami]
MENYYNSNLNVRSISNPMVGIEKERVSVDSNNFFQFNAGKHDWLKSFVGSGFSDLFIVEFAKKYPKFVAKLEEMIPEMNSMDLKTCFFIRLDLSTKEIAVLTKSSVRSVESRKYRLRKKLNLSSAVNLNLFLIRLTKE